MPDCAHFSTPTSSRNVSCEIENAQPISQFEDMIAMMSLPKEDLQGPASTDMSKEKEDEYIKV